MTFTPNSNTLHPRILLIYTGGTIGMIANPETGALEAIDFTYIEEHLPEIKRFDYSIESYSFDPVIDSSDMGPKHWIRIVDVIQKNYDSYDGFVVLHGTDTMAYTASALSFMLENLTKPVLLTGSQLPIGMIRTDGKENLLTSIEIAATRRSDGTPAVQEVCIYFNNLLLRGNRCTKSSVDHFDAFTSPNYPKLAHVGIQIHFDKTALRCCKSPDKLKVHKDLDTNIEVVTIFPGVPDSVLTSAFDTPGLRAVVMQTFGSGNAPLSETFLSTIRSAVQKGIIVLNVTQCQVGTVVMKRYSTGIKLEDAGVISGHDLTLEAAITKLMYLLGTKLSNQEICKYLEMDIRGELTT